MKGLALFHALTTQTPSIQRAVEQQALILKSIEVRELTDKVSKQQRDTSVTKLARAKTLFKANPSATRTEIIAMFVEQLGLTQAGATTYYSRLKSEG